jgi:hypothetical protein
MGSGECQAIRIFAFDGRKLVGAARELSDFEYHATKYDVAVHPLSKTEHRFSDYG